MVYPSFYLLGFPHPRPPPLLSLYLYVSYNFSLFIVMLTERNGECIGPVFGLQPWFDVLDDVEVGDGVPDPVTGQHQELPAGVQPELFDLRHRWDHLEQGNVRMGKLTNKDWIRIRGSGKFGSRWRFGFWESTDTVFSNDQIPISSKTPYLYSSNIYFP